jgi:hypothetical protein
MFQRYLLPPSSGRHGSTTQKTAIFILATMKTSNPTLIHIIAENVTDRQAHKVFFAHTIV